MKDERRGAGLGDVLGVLDADDPEVGLLPGGAEDVAGREELAPVQPAGEVEDAGALHDRVVDVEERRRPSGRRAWRGRSRPRRPRPRPRRRGPSAAAGSAACGSCPASRRARRRSRAAHAAALAVRDGASRAVRIIARMPATHDVDLARGRGGRRGPGRGSPSSRPAGRSVTWAELDDEVARVATGLGAAGLVAGHRVMIALGNRIEFVTAYLGVLRAQVGRRTGQPARHPGELARMIADSGAPDGGRRRRRRSTTVRGGRRPGRAALRRRDRRARRRPGRPLARAAGRRRRRRAGRRRAVLRRPAGRRGRARCRRCPTPRSWPCCSTPAARRAGRAPRCSPTGRCSPTSSRPPQVEPPMIHGDDVVLGVLPLFHVYGLNAVLGSVLRQRAKLVLVDALRPAGHARPDRGRGGQRACRSRRRSSPTGCPMPDLRERLGPVRLVLSGLGAAVAPSWSSSSPTRTGDPGPPGLRPDRGGAGGHQHAVQRASSSPARSAPRCPASRSGCVDELGQAARGRGRRRDLDPRRQPVQRLLARRRRRPRRRGLVGHRRRRLPRRARRPVPGRPAQGAGDRLGVQRLPERGRGRDPRGAGGRRGGRDRGRRRARPARRSSPTSKPAPAATTPRPSRTPYASTARVRLARFKQPIADRGRRRAAAARSPARCRRAGCAASSAAARWGCSSDRDDRPGHPLLQARAATCATTPARWSSRSAPSWASPTTRSTSPPTPSLRAPATARRSR